MGRIVALDFGMKRTGIAHTDEMQLIASGLTTVATPELIPFLVDYLKTETVDVLVVGEPKQMDNSASESEELIQAFLKKLKAACPDLTVARQDERFTSKLAVQSMVASGMKKKKRQDKALVDEISAVLILQAYLDRKPFI